MLPPHELRNKEFSRVMRGYNPVEVDEHINFIIDKYTELFRENDELERKLRAAYTKLDEIKTDEESIRSAMVNAQRASSKIMAEANDRADIILNTARKSCDRLMADFKKRIKQEQAVLLALNSAVSEFKEKLYKTYNDHISYIEDIKPLDADTIAQYAQTEDGFTAQVIGNVKKDIIKLMSESNAGDDDTQEADDRIMAPAEDTFVEASLVAQQPVMRQANVKDTIKEINKRILNEDGDAQADKETDADIKTPEEEMAEKEYSELLENLGMTNQFEVPKKAAPADKLNRKTAK